ncbi:MAG TPA: DUF4082 domain-containing protein [Candidatus Limnocylindria bacterium]|nr:DUF4082 domain-containing protein [Candidatus Limnocylindria bacterium]
MKRSMIIGGFILIASLASTRGVDGDVAGLNLYQSVGPGTVTEPAATSLIDAWNDTQPYASVGTYAATCFGFAYVPPQQYTLERIEFYAGGLAGAVTVSVHADDGSGYPTGASLGSVSYGESATLGWQGANLVPAVALTAGTTYYIKYVPVNGADATTAGSGTVIPHSFGDCSTWTGPVPAFFWMARFYGMPAVTATTPVTWSRIKILYR